MPTLKERPAMKKRKHRVVVEITLDEACTEKSAANRVRDILNLYASSMEASARYGFTKVSCKEFSRVVRPTTTCQKHGCSPLQHNPQCPKHRPCL
jgi:hypothetical protein